jgi:NAD(P) transhydrogenase subunit alpha
MKIAVPKERRQNESRVAASPETVKKLVALGFDVAVEKGAGNGASFADADYRDAGATVSKDNKTCTSGADFIFKVQSPTDAELADYPKGARLVSVLGALSDKALVKKLADAGLTSFAMELVPRITRAQSMDVLSSQANLAGYKAVLDAAAEFGRAMPMMMTAAGTIPPAKVCILGAGVAGLQAIATARRLGGAVSAYDVRPAVKEQVESLGAKFVEVDPEATADAETSGGYAKEMSDDYKKKQEEALHNHLKKMDMVITTAQIPGRPAPRLITEEMLKDMPAGSVVVDLAVESGGNCFGSEPGKIVVKHGVKIVGHANVPGRLAEDDSKLYAKNLLNFLTTLVDKESKSIKIDWDDEIIKGSCVTRDGTIVHPALTGEGDK